MKNNNNEYKPELIESNLNEEEILNEIKDIDEFEIKYFLFKILYNKYTLFLSLIYCKKETIHY